MGSALVPFKRALVSSYRPSVVTFPLSLRVSEILLLLCSSTPLFPTPPLVSPKFSHVPLGVGGWSSGFEERRLWPIFVVRLVSKISNLYGPDPSTLQTDRQTDRRTTCNLNTALCAIVHRAVTTTYKSKAVQQMHNILTLSYCELPFNGGG